ncbi:mycothiol system anti-sigma-R factor [Rhodococcus sp. X156]|uniref:mycothiol system anti-sigma-R factor n=1 Tax=Rhodococcus sp. X156 TaxID=2499145 RepID=UPI000FDB9B2F|nr:mycothiol system anti-sigma-R factor [Rhodococcus sp. X156]
MSPEVPQCSGSGEADCATVLADVYLYLDGECDEQGRQRVQRHLDDCSPCLHEFGIEEQVKKLLSRKCGGEHAPAGLRERLVVSLKSTVISYQETVVSDEHDARPRSAERAE